MTPAVAVAAAAAVEQVVGVAPLVKWPNDLVAGGRKLAGILAEASWPPGVDIASGWRAPSASVRVPVVVGMGLNVRAAGRAPELDAIAVACDELGGEVPEQAAAPMKGHGELIGVIAALLVLVLAFGSVVGAGLPVAVALGGLAVGSAGVTLLAATMDVSTAAPMVASMVGLGVGIDYALLLVTRHVEYLRAGHSVPDAAGRAAATAGRSVVFASSTVLVSLMGLPHVERNGHHFVDGFAGRPKAEAVRFMESHPDIYADTPRGPRLAIRDGAIEIRSLATPGLGATAEPDYAAMEPMPKADWR